MARLYRKAALDKVSSREQLDKALIVISPMSWLALIGVSIIVAAAAVWSVFGTVTQTVTARGMISAPAGTNAVYADGSGQITEILVQPGSNIRIGDALLRYRTDSNEINSIVSDQEGTVSMVRVSPEDTVSQGRELVRVSPPVAGSQVAVCFIPLPQAQKIERGMQVHVYVDSAGQKRTGHLLARVIALDSHAAPASGIEQIVGTENQLAEMFQQDGPVVAVTCEFCPEETDGIAANGASVTAKIVTKEAAPASILFSGLKGLWGE